MMIHVQFGERYLMSARKRMTTVVRESSKEKREKIDLLILKEIKMVVSMVTKTPLSLIENCIKKQEAVRCREYICMFVDKKTNLSDECIGRHLGGKSRVAVFQMRQRAIDRLFQQDAFFMEYYEDVERELKRRDII